MFLLAGNIPCIAAADPAFASNPLDTDKPGNIQDQDKNPENDTFEKKNRKKNKKKKNKKKDNDQADTEEEENPDSFIRGEIEEPVLDLD